MDHDGFSFIECLSECVEFYEGAFDASNPRKAASLTSFLKATMSPMNSRVQARGRTFPGKFGIFYKVNRRDEEQARSRHQRGRAGEGGRQKDWNFSRPVQAHEIRRRTDALGPGSMPGPFCDVNSAGEREFNS